MLKPKLQSFGHLMRTTDSLEKTLTLGKIEGGRMKGKTEERQVGWHHWLDGQEFEQALGVGDGQGSLACCSVWLAKSWTQLSNWTELNNVKMLTLLNVHSRFSEVSAQSPVAVRAEMQKTILMLVWTSEVAQSCLTLFDPMDCSPPGSSVHGILQARILECVAIPFFRGSSWPRDQTQISHISGRFFTI